LGVSVRYLILAALFISVYLVAEETYKVDIDSKGIKTFYNKKPADPDFKIELKKIGEISPDYIDSLDIDMSGKNNISVYDFDFDKDGNIIILDYNRMWKFSREGKFIKNWSRQGYGPGEFVNPFHFHMIDDTIFVNNSVSRKFIKFDIYGNFINDINMTNSLSRPGDIFYADHNYLLGSVGGFIPEENRSVDKIVMFDRKKIEEKKTLFQREYKQTSQGVLNGINDLLCAGDEKVFFVVENSFNDYKINCYDSKTGNLKYKIRKNHIRVKSDKKKENHYGFYNGEKVMMKTGTNQFEEAINEIFYDQYDRLWVNSNHRGNDEDKESMYFDIFKDGIFLNRVKLGLNYNYIYCFKLKGNKIVEYGGDGYVDIYEFK
jgi:hypothetical protein